MNRATGGQTVASPSELVELLHICTRSLGLLYLVIDGIDECCDQDAVVRGLLSLADSTNVKVLIFSRPNVDSLFRQVTETERVTMEASSVKGDIKLYLTNQLTALSSEGYLPPDANTSELATQLLYGADGMFLWARLMLAYLRSPAFTPDQRVTEIGGVRLPEGLPDMYQRILSQIKKCPGAESLATQVFTWLTFSTEFLTLEMLYQAIVSYELSEDPTSFQRSVVVTCGGLLEVGERNIIRFIHLSVRDYFIGYRNNPGSQGHIQTQFKFPSKAESNLQIGQKCLSYLTCAVPAGPLSGSLGLLASRPQTRRNFPLLSYAALSWVGHLHQSIPMGLPWDPQLVLPDASSVKELVTALSRFLGHPRLVMTWVEAFYLFSVHRSPPAFDDLRTWCKKLCQTFPNISSTRISKDIMEFSSDLARLHRSWGETLFHGPFKIWGDVTGFHTSRFLAQTKAVRVESLASTLGQGTQLMDSPLCHCSRPLHDGLQLAVLSIWPRQ